MASIVYRFPKNKFSYKLAEKNDEDAENFRKAGNEAFKVYSWFSALYNYNCSLAYAKTKKVLSLAYANRSAVYYELHRYEECLRNIQWARNGYPEHLISKLNAREEKCKERMKIKTSDDPWEFFKMSYPANSKVPWIAECLEMRKTIQYGRGIYAKCDLKIGDIVAIIEPEIILPDSLTYHVNCANCFKICMMNLIPCPKTASMMFCSNECMDQCFAKTVDKENMMCEDVVILSEIASRFGGIDNFNNFAKNTNLKELEDTIFDYDFSNRGDPNYQSNMAKCLLSLTSIRNKKWDFYDSNFYIRKHTSKSTADHILGIYAINQIHCFNENGAALVMPHGRNFISTFTGLINHSCIPNITIQQVDNKIIVIIMRPIKAGEQLFHSYYPNPADKRIEDVIKLTEMYCFVCNCYQCTHPNYVPLRIRPVPLEYINRDNFNVARKCLQEGWRFMNSNNEKHASFALQKAKTFGILMKLAIYCNFPF